MWILAHAGSTLADMRDHTKLRALELADSLALLVYRNTASFPRDEQFGLTAQMRRASVSIASNIVEGCGRETIGDYIRFFDIAHASARELEYQISLARRLEYLAISDDLDRVAEETCKVLNGLLRALRKQD
jgi:four helix bundle protein